MHFFMYSVRNGLYEEVLKYTVLNHLYGVNGSQLKF